MFALEYERKRLREWRYELAIVQYELKWRAFFRTAIKAGYKETQPRDESGRWTSTGGIDVTTSGNFLTGISAIDETSVALSNTLVRVMEAIEYLPTMSPQIYGVAVHMAFGLAVRLQSLPGVGDIERSFSLDDSDPRYGLAGTVRTDVTLRNIMGDVVAIYDVKTGQREMSRSRANRLREVTGALPTTPVFELNIVRGINRKSLWLVRRIDVPNKHAM